jgi:hypothetical protein
MLHDSDASDMLGETCDCVVCVKNFNKGATEKVGHSECSKIGFQGLIFFLCKLLGNSVEGG